MINPTGDPRASQRFYRLKVTAWAVGLVAAAWAVGLVAAVVLVASLIW